MCHSNVNPQKASQQELSEKNSKRMTRKILHEEPQF